MTRAHPQPSPPAQRGYAIFYRQNEPNHCPGCGRSAWHVGRQSAECAACATAIPLIAPYAPIQE